MSTPDGVPVLVLVLAGGASRRFGADKLAADLAGASLLDRALAGVPAGLPVVVVGPPRPVTRRVDFVREDPPGGGPGAALVRGLVEALSRGAEVVVTLPGDAPDAGAAVPELLAQLGGSGAGAVVAVDAEGREQPLQVGFTAAVARAFVTAAGPGAGAGESVRRMLAALDPRPLPTPVAPATLLDIDTPAQAERWRSTHPPTPAP